MSHGAVPGALVVYGSSYGLFGHIATACAVEADHYEVIEQNFLDFSPTIESNWATFDLAIGGLDRLLYGLQVRGGVPGWGGGRWRRAAGVVRVCRGRWAAIPFRAAGSAGRRFLLKPGRED